MDALAPADLYDVFLSHATSDREWVHPLSAELRAHGLRVFVDAAELRPGGNYVQEIAAALRDSRFLVVVLSPSSSDRPWVTYEWTTFKAKNGPLGRVIPVLLEDVELPTGLLASQVIHAKDRDFRRVAVELLRAVGRSDELTADDPRLSPIGQELTYVLKPLGETVEIITPDCRVRQVTAPWRADQQFSHALQLFKFLALQPIQNCEEWVAITDYARAVGRALYDVLFDEGGAELLRRAVLSGRTPPALTILSEDAEVLALPWELLHDGARFLLPEGGLDLMRSAAEVSFSQALGPPAPHFRLLVNVSAPQSHEFSYEEESYRISKVLSDRCDMITCELGTVDDLVTTAARFAPVGIHFSGHGGPGTLIFETNENDLDQVPVSRLVQRLRAETPTGLPHFFYLASCHGNTPTPAPPGRGPETSAAKLHGEGVTEVIGYFGPIAEELSTRAEEALYSAISAGRTTRFAVRQARLTLANASAREMSAPEHPREPTYPFAWSQLVFYRRGPEHPLILPEQPGDRPRLESLPQRTFQDAGNRRILISGFIGRRTELHSIRRRLRRSQRVFFFHGLGGLGKTTLAVHLLSWLGTPDEVCVIWCQELAGAPELASALVERLIDYGEQRFGADFGDQIAALDQQSGDDPAGRCRAVVGLMAARATRLVIYFDNLESLLVSPDDRDAATAFAQWRSDDLRGVWQTLLDHAENTTQLWLLASSRYFNDSIPFKYQFPVSPLKRDAVFRLTKWFAALRRLSWRARSRLAECLDGHPRAVELANALVDHALERWEFVRGQWRTPDPSDEKEVKEEWEGLVGPALPAVQGKLESDLLLDAIWDRALTDEARRMLYRMSLMRRADRWAWGFVLFFGDTDMPTAETEATAALLLRSSLLVAFEEHPPWAARGVTERFYGLHPSTAEHVRRRFGDDPELRQQTHYRIARTITALGSEDEELKQLREHQLLLFTESCYHFFECGHYDEAVTAAGQAAMYLLLRNRPRQALQLFQPFQKPEILPTLTPGSQSKMFDYIARSYRDMRMFDQAVEFQEKALEAARDTENEAAAVGNLANLHLKMKQHDLAISLLERALELARAKNDRELIAVQLSNIGAVYLDLREAERGIKYLEEAIALASEVGDYDTEANLANNMGGAYVRLGEHQKAVASFERAAHLAQERGLPLTQEMALSNLGRLYADAGQVEKAVACFGRALEVARQIGNLEGELKILGDLADKTYLSGDLTSASEYSRQAIRVARGIGDQNALSRAYFTAAMISYQLRQWEKAINFFEQSLTVLRELGDTEKTRVCLGMIGNSWGELDRPDEQLKAYEAALALSRSIHSQKHEHHCLAQLGAVHYASGRFDETVKYFEEALAVLNQCAEQTQKADYLNNLGAAYAALGRIDEAVNQFAQGAEIYRREGDSRGELQLLQNASGTCLKHERYEQGAALLERILEINREIGEPRALLNTLEMLASAHAVLRAFEPTVNYLNQAVELTRRLGDKKAELDMHTLLAAAYHEMNSPDKEIQCQSARLSLARDIGERAAEGAALSRLGRLLMGSGEPEKAVAYLEESVRVWEEMGDESKSLAPLNNLGGSLLYLDQPQRAIEYLERAVRVARKIGDRSAEGQAVTNLGTAQSELGDREAATESFKTALLIGKEIGNPQLVQIATTYLESPGAPDAS
jgi:tetratricopeptide (TPR) repeat protein